MSEALALGVLGGICLAVLTVIAIVVKRLYFWIARKVPSDIEGMARATGRATANTKKRATSIVQAFREGKGGD